MSYIVPDSICAEVHMADREMIMAAKKGNPKAQGCILDEYMGAIREVARRFDASFRWQGSHYDDLEQEAMIGFFKALGKYDPDNENGCSLLSYAMYSMNLECRQYLNKAYRVVRIPKWQCERLHAFNKVLAKLGPDRSEEEYAEAMGVSEEEVREIMMIRYSQLSISLDEPKEEEEGRSLILDIASEENLQDDFEQANELAALDAAIHSVLSNDEAFLIESVYGLGGKARLQVAEIARNLGITAATVRNRRRAIEEKLRIYIEHAA